MVTSCKDYDDDIDGLQSQINDINGVLKGLKEKIESGSVITRVDPVTDGVKITLSNNTAYTITNGKDGVNGTVWTIGEDGF